MSDFVQLAFPFVPVLVQPAEEKYYSGRELGTFKDSLRAPVHRWFRYPAGFSYKFILESIDLFKVSQGEWLYDPFSGTGTTLITAKQQGINAYGVEAHSFVHQVAETKLYWDFDYKLLEKQIEKLLLDAKAFIAQREIAETAGIFPELIYKCYHPQDLKILYLLREFILKCIEDVHVQDFCKLALTDTLRGAAAAGTGWPYIAPRKNTGRQPPKDAFKVLQNTLWLMYSDLRKAAKTIGKSDIRNVQGDSRQKQDLVEGQVKLAITSPPYLNNYDYADRTRLETYFWGLAHTWGDITRNYRDKLMVAATTQVTRSKYDVETVLSKEIQQIAPETYQTIQTAILALAQLRTKKGGKKDYDLMTGLYFNDMLAVMKETYRVLESNGHFCLVLGDSAPYGVHIPTDNLIGEIGLALGFRHFDYYELRRRGEKWKENPQRHKVPLREGIVILKK